MLSAKVVETERNLTGCLTDLDIWNIVSLLGSKDALTSYKP